MRRVNAALAARVSQFRSIIAFRNVRVHAYADVDDRIVWDIVETELPLLRAEATALLGETEKE